MNFFRSVSKLSPSFINPLFAFNNEWKSLEESAERYVFQHLLDDDGKIRYQTRLYHGTRNPNLVLSDLDPERVTFFGIEPVICMWYTLEEAERLNLPDGNSYVYEFVIIDPIPIQRYIPSIKEHPGFETSIHPQVALHGYNNYHALMGPFDLSVEVTLRHSDLSCLQQVSCYKVQRSKLQQYISFSRRELNLIQSREELQFESKKETAEKVKSKLRKFSLTKE